MGVDWEIVMRFSSLLVFFGAVVVVFFTTGCPECDCEGPLRICPDQFTNEGALTCTYSDGACGGCESPLTLYTGEYQACREVDNPSQPCDDCDPSCYEQQCTKETFSSTVDCSRYSYDANVCWSRNCKYEASGGSSSSKRNLQAWGGTVYVRPMLQAAA